MIHKDDKILLGMKKKGFGAGRWNGFGGKVKEGEVIEMAAIREVREESGVEVMNIEKVGVLEFEFENDLKVMEVHIFSATEFSGELTESDEMRPQWFDFDNIPYNEMWSDDQYWLPLLLDGKKFEGKFLFDKPSTVAYSAKILKNKLIEVDKIF